MAEQFSTPILLVAFNRPDTTRVVFEAVKKIKPKYLYVAADGPRKNRPDDAEKCRQTREILIDIDWQCEIKTLFHENNLGCKKAEAAAFDWFFSQVEMGIILEDDCLPEPSFFRYAEDLLQKYKDDERIMHISGNNFQRNNRHFKCPESYYFSTIPNSWGWATWRRAWLKYDVDIKKWPEVKKSGALSRAFNNHGGYEYWSRVWDQYYNGEIDSWDGQWVFACALNHGICINPNRNLVTNIGWGEDSTHCKIENLSAKLPVTTMVFPLKHPTVMKINKKADNYTLKKSFHVDNKLHYRLLRPIKIMFPSFYSATKKLFSKQ
jgi:hypothetical protein